MIVLHRIIFNAKIVITRIVSSRIYSYKEHFTQGSNNTAGTFLLRIVEY
jgi:hypothetical protein